MTTQIGHNKRRTGGVAAEQLRSIIDRIERLETEKAAIAADVRDVFAEARGNGFDLPTIRKILKLRKMDASEREEQETILATYCRALNMQGDLFDDAEDESESGGTDPLYDEAVAIVRRDRKPSTSYIQRCLHLGYNRAATLIERMEAEGVVSPANHVGKRDVLPHADDAG